MVNAHSPFWLNAYDRNNNVVASTPFESLADALKEVEETNAFFNAVMPNRPFVRKGAESLAWTNGSLTQRIESKGYWLTYVNDLWIASAANYAEDFPSGSDFAFFLDFKLRGATDEKIKSFAESFFSNPDFRALTIRAYENWQKGFERFLIEVFAEED